MSIVTLKRKTEHLYKNNSVQQRQFSLNGTHRSQGYVGQSSLSRPENRTLAKGTTLKGYGGCCGSYVESPLCTRSVNTTEDHKIVKPSVVSQDGMIASKFRWVHRPAPFTSVKPSDSLNQNACSDYTTYVKRQTLTASDNSLCSIEDNKETKCCKVNTFMKEWVAKSQNDYIRSLSAVCVDMDASFARIPSHISRGPILGKF